MVRPYRALRVVLLPFFYKSKYGATLHIEITFFYKPLIIHQNHVEDISDEYDLILYSHFFPTKKVTVTRNIVSFFVLKSN